MTSLGVKIAKLSNPKPLSFDEEEDYSDSFENAEVSEEREYQKSELRCRNAPLLEDIDSAYVGRKVSRISRGLVFNKTENKTTNSSDVESNSDNSSSLNSQSSEEDESSDDKEDLDESDISNFKKKLDKSYSVSEEEHDSESSDDQECEKNGLISQFANIDVTSEIEKGKAIKAQEEIWNKLCEARIKLQKLLILSNKLPQTDTLKLMTEKKSEEMSNLINKDNDSLKQLLNTLIDLQTELGGKNKKEDESSDNLDILSSDEDGIDKEEDDEETTGRKGVKRKLKNEDYDNKLSKQFKSEKLYRNCVIQKWDDKVRLSTGRMTQKSFSAFGNSAVKQIDQVLQDKNRLIKRTQLKRSVYRTLGKPEYFSICNKNDGDSENPSKQDMLLKDYDPEIFDDDDFYRQLLKDIIQSKSFGMDPSIVRKQMELQTIRNKMKRKVDTKASKGRKLRYDIHPKLVNFMAPIQTCTITDEARENLLKCLFGKSAVS